MLKKFVGAATLLAVDGAASCQDASVTQVCSNATYGGIYSYLLNGTVTAIAPSTALAKPYAQLGKITADGNGNLSGQAMESNNLEWCRAWCCRAPIR